MTINAFAIPSVGVLIGLLALTVLGVALILLDHWLRIRRARREAAEARRNHFSPL